MAFSSAAVRRFLSDAFSDDELDALCFDYFLEAHNDFSSGMSKGDKIQLLIEYCQQREGIEALFLALKELRPEQYLKHFGSQPPPNQFEATFTPANAPSSTELSILSLAEMTERRIAAQSEYIRFYQRIASGLIAGGLLVVVVVLLPVLPVSFSLRPMIAVGGVFICSLSGLQFRLIDRHKERISECMVLRTHLESLKKQPMLDEQTRAQVTHWMNLAFEGAMKTRPT